MAVVGTKVTPPERAVMRNMSSTHWASAATIAGYTGMVLGDVSSKLRRLEALGHVQAMPAQSGKQWRLTPKGLQFKQGHLAGWRTLVGWGGDPRTTSVRSTKTKRVGRVTYPYNASGKADPTLATKWGVQYGEAFAWEYPEDLEVLV
jgi:hypothetical protein